jgi:hypothetical protein
MSALARTLLLWIMVAVMPVQAMAAALMQSCGPSHERMAPARTVQERSATPVRVDGAGHAHRHAHRHDHDAPASASVHDPAAPHGPLAHDCDADEAGGACAHHAGFSCSACAACCSMPAMPASFALHGRATLAEPLPPSAVAPLRSHRPDEPDRPPRARLA